MTQSRNVVKKRLRPCQGIDLMPSKYLPVPLVKRRTTKAATTVFGILIFMAAPTAAQWRVAPSIGAGLTYDDNFFLVDDNLSTESVNGWALGAEVRFSYDSQLTEFSLTPRLRLDKYDSDLDLDTNSAFLDFDYLYTGQLSQFQFRGSYSDETIRTGERSDIDFDVNDPDDIPSDDSGRVIGTDDRQRIFLAPNWSYRTGDRSSVRLNATYLDVTYDEVPFGFLRDYIESRIQASFEYDMSEKNTVGLSGYYRQSDFEQADSDIEGYGLHVDFQRSLSETTLLRVKMGADSTEDNTGVDRTNPIGEISVIHNLQTSQILASYRRSVQGSGAAELSVRDALSLNITRNLSEKFKVGAGIIAYQTSALDDNTVSFDERDYVQIGGLFVWRLTRALSVNFDYRYTYLDRKSSDSDASSNAMDLWFRYSPTL